MTRQLRRRIWTRLALVALVLGALVGGVVFVLERASIMRRVRQHATAEAQRLVDHARLLSRPGPGDADARREIAAHLSREHLSQGPFVVLELYDTSRTKVVEVADPRFLAVARAAEGRRHVSSLTDTLTQQPLTVGDEAFLQVFAPLQGAEGTFAYFEGVYRVGDDVVAALNRGLLLVLGVVLVVLAAVAVLYPVILRLNADLLGLSADLSHANMGLLVALGSAVAKRDRGTNSHNYRVTLYAARLAEEVGLPPERIRGLIKGAFLHDVGKIAVQDAILQKPGSLTAEESAAMRAHVTQGVELVSKFRWLDDALEVVQCHHEKYDGTGYPAGLQAGEIPVAARVFAIVDVFDALTTRRPYKIAAPLHEAVFTLLGGRGTAFDPDLLDRFLAIAPELHRTVCAAPEAELGEVLDGVLARYFSHEERRARSARREPGSSSGEAEGLTLTGAFWLDGPRKGSRRHAFEGAAMSGRPEAPPATNRRPGRLTSGV